MSDFEKAMDVKGKNVFLNGVQIVKNGVKL
jgi:hypothetical protein